MKGPRLDEATERIETGFFDGGKFVKASEPVVKELSLEIIVNGRPLVSLACTGLHLRELALGFLRSEGLAGKLADIESIEVDAGPPRACIVLKGRIPAKSRTRSIASSGARSVSAAGPARLNGPGLRITPRRVVLLMKRLLQSAKIHDLTRGTHCSALADSHGLIAAREDIGRHNTIDMLGGFALLNGIDCSDKILLTTGRISAEMVIKASRIGVPMVISHSAATSRAVRLAGELGMTLAGYVRGGKFRLYAGDMVSK